MYGSSCTIKRVIDGSSDTKRATFEIRYYGHYSSRHTHIRTVSQPTILKAHSRCCVRIAFKKDFVADLEWSEKDESRNLKMIAVKIGTKIKSKW